MKSQTDACGVVTACTLDALDRSTQATFSDGTPAVTYAYDAPCAFGVGSLCSLAEGGTTVAYAYDRFGRVLQDGAVTYGYDANGNRTQIGYPGGLTAAYTFDFADRQATLAYDAGAGSVPVVTGARYLSSGPLTALSLGNGLAETHAFDARYFPASVAVTGTTALHWTYTVDGVGNPTSINDGTTNRVYAYVDQLYFLKQGDGPWGTRSWTYDRIGNRLTETRGATTDTYGYPSGHNPRLTSISLGTGGTKRLVYDPAGNELQESGPTGQLDLSYDGANRLIRMAEETTRSSTSLTYDGRNFLSEARQDLNLCNPTMARLTYSSAGLLLQSVTSNRLTNLAMRDVKILYFAGRPIAFVDAAASPESAVYLTVDHAGTPILQTNIAGSSLWSGGFEPFGRDWNGAQVAGESLRFPGQSEDATWSTTGGAGFEYNLLRWYNSTSGRYTAVDPVSGTESSSQFIYARANPSLMVDPTGALSFQGEGPVYHYGNWDEVVRACHGQYAGGCTIPSGRLDCKCRCVQGGWKPEVNINYAINTFVATNSPDDARTIRAHEEKHVGDYLRVFSEIKCDAVKLEGEQYRWKWLCDVNCRIFLLTWTSVINSAGALRDALPR